MRNILIVQQHSPFNCSSGREALDLALALAAVEHSVSMLFCADAVYQLLATTDQADFKLKAYPRGFSLFGLYDIEQVFVCQQALTTRRIDTEQLSIAVTPLDRAGITALISNQHQVITS
jgi:tRNA 2-thiouridine synthesizing protein C